MDLDVHISMAYAVQCLRSLARTGTSVSDETNVGRCHQLQSLADGAVMSSFPYIVLTIPTVQLFSVLFSINRLGSNVLPVEHAVKIHCLNGF